MSYKDILKIIPSIQSAKLAEHNIKKLSKKKTKTKDIIDLGITDLVGVELIKLESDMI